MYSVPNWFAEALEREFRGEYRIRWSPQKHEWHLEQRVGRAVTPPARSGKDYDRWVRAKDGYALVYAVQAGSRRPCPDCGEGVDVPQLKFKEMQCGWCGFKGRSGKWILGYFPLNEKLIDQLKKGDPRRDHVYRELREMDLHNARVELAQDKGYEFERQEALRDWAYSQFPVAGLPMKEKHAPWNLPQE